MRLFFALVFDEPTLEALVEARRSFDVETGVVRWIDPSHLHLTLQFLGSVEESVLSAVTDAARGATSMSGSFELRLQGLGSFPAPREKGGGARVLWAGVSCCPPLQELFEQLGSELDRRGVDRDSRSLRPHVTLGRPARRSRKIRLHSPPDPEVSIATIVVRELRLIESVQSAAGLQYRVLERFPLGAP